jgi:hypothetical protein
MGENAPESKITGRGQPGLKTYKVYKFNYIHPDDPKA